MARDGSGTYSLPQAAFTASTTIESAKVNSDFSDIASALTQSISKDGQTTYTASQPMGGFKLTGLGAGTGSGESVRYDEFRSSLAPATTAGTSTAYTLTYSPAPAALVDGMTHLVQFNAANGAAATLNVNSLGAVPLYYYSSGAWRAAPAALWDADEIFRVIYHTSTATYRVMRPGAPRTGAVVDFAGSTVPGGFLLCYGQAVGRAGYAGLFNALGTTYGVGDGSTTFNLPDLRGRVGAGKDDMGGSAANRITSTTVANSPQLGSTGGAQTQSLASGATSGTMAGTTGAPSQTATVDDSTQTRNVGNEFHTHSVTVSGTLTVTGTTAVVQPTIILNKMIAI